MLKHLFSGMMNAACLSLALFTPLRTVAQVLYFQFEDYPTPDGKHRIHAEYHGGNIPILAQLQRKTNFGHWKEISRFSLPLPDTNYPSKSTFSSDMKYWITIGSDDYNASCFGTRTFNKNNPVEIRIYQLPEGNIVSEIKLNELIPDEEIKFWLENKYGKRDRAVPVVPLSEKGEANTAPPIKTVVRWNIQEAKPNQAHRNRDPSSVGYTTVVVTAPPVAIETTSTSVTTTFGGDDGIALSMGATLSTNQDGNVVLETFWGRIISINPAAGQIIANLKSELEIQTVNGDSAVDMMRRRDNKTLWRHMARWLEANGESTEIPAMEAFFLNGDGWENQGLLNAILSIDGVRYINFLAQLLDSPIPRFRITAINRLHYAKISEEARRTVFFKKALDDADASVRQQAIGDLVQYLAYVDSRLLSKADRNELLGSLRNALNVTKVDDSNWYLMRDVKRIADMETLQFVRGLLVKTNEFYEKDKKLQEIDTAIQGLLPKAPGS